jgi:multiple sugar transport system permease protein
LWFHDPQWAKPGLVLLSLWAVGDLMVIMMAALLDVGGTARGRGVDGASARTASAT